MTSWLPKTCHVWGLCALPHILHQACLLEDVCALPTGTRASWPSHSSTAKNNPLYVIKRDRGSLPTTHLLDDNTSHYILMHFSSNFLKMAFIKTKTAFLGKQAKCALKYVKSCFIIMFFFFTLIDYCFLLESNDIQFNVSYFGSLRLLIHRVIWKFKTTDTLCPSVLSFLHSFFWDFSAGISAAFWVNPNCSCTYNQLTNLPNWHSPLHMTPSPFHSLEYWFLFSQSTLYTTYTASQTRMVIFSIKHSCTQYNELHWELTENSPPAFELQWWFTLRVVLLTTTKFQDVWERHKSEFWPLWLSSHVPGWKDFHFEVTPCMFLTSPSVTSLVSGDHLLMRSCVRKRLWGMRWGTAVRELCWEHFLLEKRQLTSSSPSSPSSPSSASSASPSAAAGSRVGMS